MGEPSAFTFIGMDVSKETVAIAMLRPGEHVPLEQTVPNTVEAMRKQLRRWGDPAVLRVCYEAGPTGYALQRQLAAAGVDCIVVAPALIPKRPGSRVKTDRRDARDRCRLHRAGELTAVRVPDPDEEIVRDLVRAREDQTEDILRARHRTTKLLLRHGHAYREGKGWTQKHLRWIRTQELGSPLLRELVDHHLAVIDGRLAQRAWRTSVRATCLVGGSLRRTTDMRDRSANISVAKRRCHVSARSPLRSLRRPRLTGRAISAQRRQHGLGSVRTVAPRRSTSAAPASGRSP